MLMLIDAHNGWGDRRREPREAFGGASALSMPVSAGVHMAGLGNAVQREVASTV
jgi:hypothetical protein